MRRNLICLFLIMATLFGGTSCSDFNKLQKKGTDQEKFDAAMEYYKKEDYLKAQLLFEELASSVYRTSDKAQDILYFQAMTNYKLGDYILSGYEFKNFHRTFPTSERAEECLYLSAYCHYLESPPYSLDQTDTRDAINQFQYFIKLYPTSPRVAECNKLVDKLHEKLEKKAFMIARQYFNIGDYKAAVASFANLLRDYPDTKYREEALFYSIKANYLLAINSINTKAEERVKSTIEAYNKFKTAYAVSTFSSDADNIYNDALKYRQKLEDEKKKNKRKDS